MVSISLALPCHTNKNVEETNSSKWARVITAVHGIIGFGLGLIILSRGSHLGAGLGILSGGISLTLIAALIKCVKDSQTQSPAKPSVAAKVEINASLIPNDIWKIILSLSNPEDLARWALVAKAWKALIDEKMWQVVWQKDPDVFYDFKPLVDKKIVTWKDVGVYAHFSRFLRRINEHKHHTSLFIEKENPHIFPRFANRESLMTLHFPKPWVSSGSYNFWVNNVRTIKMQAKNGTDCHFFEGEKSKHFIYLAVDGPFLFALQNDGLIFQWNYLTKEKVQEIETAYMREDGFWKSIKADNFDLPLCSAFHVQAGYIVLKYGNSKHRTFEIISYRYPESKRQVVTDVDVSSTHRISIRQKKLYMLGSNSLYIRDIEKGEKIQCFKIEKEKTGFLNDSALHKNSVYSVSSRAETLYQTDLSTGMTQAAIGCNADSHIITVSDKRIYGFHREIHVLNLETGERGSISEIFSYGPGHTSEIKPEVLEKLVQNEQKINPQK